MIPKQGGVLIKPNDPHILATRRFSTPDYYYIINKFFFFERITTDYLFDVKFRLLSV